MVRSLLHHLIDPIRAGAIVTHRHSVRWGLLLCPQFSSVNVGL